MAGRHCSSRYDSRKPGLRRCSKRLSPECRKRAGWWPAIVYAPGATNSDGLHSHCPECRRAISRAWKKRNRVHCREYLREWKPARRRELRRKHYELNTEHEKKRSAAWRKQHPVKRRTYQRARYLRIKGRLTDADWAEVLKAYGSSCLACKRRGTVTIDHVVPLTRGGTNTKDNVQPLCRSCNSKKKAKTVDYRPDKGRRWTTSRKS